MKLKTLLAVAILTLVIHGSADAATDFLVDQNDVATRATPPAKNPESAQPAIAAVSTLDPAVPQVELYVTSWCPYCKQAENFFRSQGIPFIAYDVEKDSRAARRKEQLDSSGGVPLAIINGEKIHGFSPEAYRQALKKKP